MGAASDAIVASCGYAKAFQRYYDDFRFADWPSRDGDSTFERFRLSSVGGESFWEGHWRGGWVGGLEGVDSRREGSTGLPKMQFYMFQVPATELEQRRQPVARVEFLKEKIENAVHNAAISHSH